MALGAATTICALLGPHESFAANPVRVRLRPTASAGASSCVPKGAIIAGTNKRLKREVFTLEQPDAEVTLYWDVDDAHKVARFRLEETATGARIGHRDLSAESCAELEASVVLALTLMLDFSADEIAERREPQSELTNETAENSAGTTPPTDQTGAARTPNSNDTANGTTKTDAPVQHPVTAENLPKKPTLAQSPTVHQQPSVSDQRPAERSRGAWRWSSFATLDGAWGWAPSTDLGVGVFARSARGEQLQFDLGVLFWRPVSSERSGGSLDLARQSAELYAYPMGWRAGALGAHVGVVMGIDHLRAGGHDFSTNQTKSVWLGSGGLALELEFELNAWLRAHLGGSARTPFGPADFVVFEDASRHSVFSMSRVLGSARFGIGAEF
ncbi:MAG TPA: hypothetical protein VHM70_25680 [Polyangiaceae bacterium]|jgi:hypothetical protein|nr:hypothetical protein [Polyangiaceae bacterium]